MCNFCNSVMDEGRWTTLLGLAHSSLVYDIIQIYVRTIYIHMWHSQVVPSFDRINCHINDEVLYQFANKKKVKNLDFFIRCDLLKYSGIKSEMFENL